MYENENESVKQIDFELEKHAQSLNVKDTTNSIHYSLFIVDFKHSKTFESPLPTAEYLFKVNTWNSLPLLASGKPGILFLQNVLLWRMI